MNKKLTGLALIALIIAAGLVVVNAENNNIKDIFIELPDTNAAPQELKQSALQVMNDLRETPEVRDNGNNLEKANTIISLIEESLLSEYWWTEEFARDENVFKLEEQAAQQMRVLHDRERPDEVNKEMLIESLSFLVKADERLAKRFIELAEYALPFLQDYDIQLYNEVNTALSNAYDNYDRAFEHIESGRPVVSIEFFRKAWAEINETVVVLDSVTIPEVTIENPLDGSFTNQPSQTVSGNVFDVLIFTITEAQLIFIGNSQAIVLNNGLFSHGVTLTEGANSVSIEATDLFGNTGTGSITVVLDTIPPEIIFNGVNANEYYNIDVIPTIHVIDANPDVLTAKLNGQDFASGTPVSIENDYSLTVEAVDKAGNSDEKSIVFVIDKTPPITELISPEENSFVGMAVEVAGSIFDMHPDKTELFVDNAIVSNSIPFNLNTESYADGSHEIKLTATDKAGNSSSTITSINVDNTPPEISNIEPLDSSFVRQSVQADVQVIELNLEKTELIIDNVVVSNSFPFEWDTTVETDGTHVISFVAIDKAGNQTTKTIQVTVDNTAPDLFVEELIVNPTLDEPDYYLQGNIKDNFGIQSFKINGADTTISDDSFEFDTTIVEGENNFDFMAIDFAGNQSSYHIARLVDEDDLPDFYETEVLKTDSLNADSDSLETTADESGNGVKDDIEDFDSDWLSNLQEYVVGSNPFNSDTDGDDLDDYFEVYNSETDSLNADSDEDGINDDSADDDDDGLTNMEEQTLGTNALSTDSDKDLLSDFDEVNIYNSNPVLVDSDDDGLADESEVWLGTNLLNSDSDDDGLVDSEEFYLQILPMNGKGIEVEINAKGDARNTVFEEVDLQEHAMLSEIGGVFRPIELVVINDFTQAKVKIFYDETELSDSKAEDIIVTYFNEQTHGLELMSDFEVNTTDNFIKFTTNHASSFIPIIKSDFLSVFDSSSWNIQWFPSHDVFSKGHTITIKADVSSTTITGASNVKVEFKENSLVGKTIETKTISSVSGNSSFETLINYTIGFNVDRICVVTDPTNAIDEENEGDNAACKLFPGQIDSDGDGLTDDEEINGMRVSFPFGVVFNTDSFDEDSDNDGLSDGEEMGVVITDIANYELYVSLTGDYSNTHYNGKHFQMISDPTEADSDGDGFDDKEELELGINPMKKETDNEFMMGIILGEIGLDTPKHQNLSFMGGFVVGGAIPIYEWVANARDAIYLTYKGDYEGAGLNVGFLALGVGLTATGVGVEGEDVPEAAIKAAKAVKKVPSLKKPFARILVDKFETLGKVPVVGDASVHILDKVYEGKVALLKSKGITEEAIKGFAKKQIDLGKVDTFLDEFKHVKGFEGVQKRIKVVGEAGAAFEGEVAVINGVGNVKGLGVVDTFIMNGDIRTVDFDIVLNNGKIIEAKSGKAAANSVSKELEEQAFRYKAYVDAKGIKEFEYVFSHKPAKTVRDFYENLGFIVSSLE